MHSLTKGSRVQRGTNGMPGFRACRVQPYAVPLAQSGHALHAYTLQGALVASPACEPPLEPAPAAALSQWCAGHPDRQAAAGHAVPARKQARPAASRAALLLEAWHACPSRADAHSNHKTLLLGTLLQRPLCTIPPAATSDRPTPRIMSFASELLLRRNSTKSLL